ncbi:hypothetical protein QG37_01673 [Candidozyma auris]|uniref:Uncharacterized protein n=1 Tax=Candidozyma auris TaxID=498019 RepID=A0A0L0P4Q6_CANAR|nr:hypothetical protein QG37_01673 [[Candida] auris]
MEPMAGLTVVQFLPILSKTVAVSPTEESTFRKGSPFVYLKSAIAIAQTGLLSFIQTVLHSRGINHPLQ